MKIVFITGSYPPMRCGVGDYTARLANALARTPGHQVAVVTSVAAGEERTSGDGVAVLPALPDWKLRRFPALLRLLRKQCPDLVHIQFPTQGYGRGLLPMLLPLLLRLSGFRLAQTWHEEARLRHLPEFLLKSLPASELVVVRPGFLGNLPRAFQWWLRRRTLHYISNGSSIPKASLDPAGRLAHRSALLRGQSRLVVFFGFLMPEKGAELVFDIADPASDHLVIAGDDKDGSVRAGIEALCGGPAWKGRATVTGFLPEPELAVLLAVADAVVLPFRNGGGPWNSSIHGATLQGTFVLTTSKGGEGYDAQRNVYYAHIDDVAEMRAALAKYAGQRVDSARPPADWPEIAAAHSRVYADPLRGH